MCLSSWRDIGEHWLHSLLWKRLCGQCQKELARQQHPLLPPPLALGYRPSYPTRQLVTSCPCQAGECGDFTGIWGRWVCWPVFRWAGAGSDLDNKEWAPLPLRQKDNKASQQEAQTLACGPVRRYYFLSPGNGSHLTSGQTFTSGGFSG